VRAQTGPQRQGRHRRACVHPERPTRALRAGGRGADEPAAGGRVRRASLGDLTPDCCRCFGCRGLAKRNSAPGAQGSPGVCVVQCPRRCGGHRPSPQAGSRSRRPGAAHPRLGQPPLPRRCRGPGAPGGNRPQPSGRRLAARRGRGSTSAAHTDPGLALRPDHASRRASHRRLVRAADQPWPRPGRRRPGAGALQGPRGGRAPLRQLQRATGGGADVLCSPSGASRRSSP
jgi:hypothetical protein